MPLEKVIDSPEAFDALMLNPSLFRNAIAIIEPWEHVGYNRLGEHVRASENVAYLAQTIADCDSVLFPMWSSGPFDLDKLIPVISSGLAIGVEGGDPPVRNPATFEGSNASQAEMIALTEYVDFETKEVRRSFTEDVVKPTPLGVGYKAASQRRAILFL